MRNEIIIGTKSCMILKHQIYHLNTKELSTTIFRYKKRIFERNPR